LPYSKIVQRDTVSYFLLMERHEEGQNYVAASHRSSWIIIMVSFFTVSKVIRLRVSEILMNEYQYHGCQQEAWGDRYTAWNIYTD